MDRKSVDEMKLLAHIKMTKWSTIEQHRKKKPKSESHPNDELFQKVRNNNVYKEFMKLEPSKMKFYDSRNYVSGNATDLIKTNEMNQ